MQGAADPITAFPNGTTFTPYSLVRNISNRELLVTPTLSWMVGPVPTSYRASTITLSPGETRRLPLKGLIDQSGMRASGFNLSLHTHGQSRGSLEASGSVDDKYTYVFEVASMVSVESVAKTISYWSTANGDDTMITLRNPASDPQELKIVLNFNEGDGEYTWPIHLNASESRSFNVSSIVHSNEPDEAGNVVPATTQEGRIVLMGSQGENQHILIDMDSGIYNVAKAICGNTYCKTCQGAADAWIDLDPFSLPEASTSPFGFTVQYKSGTMYDHTSVAQWSSSNSDVAQIDSSGTLTPIGVGNVSLDAYDSDVPDYSDDCFRSNPDAVCPMATGTDGSSSGSINDQTPIIDGIDPSVWPSGNTTQVTITGQYFGTTAPTLGFSPGAGISYTFNSYSDTQVVANITVASGVPTEDVAVTLTSSGYGTGFQPGSSGASATSAPSDARVNAPSNAPEITVIGWVDASAVTLPTGENPTLQANLTNGGFACVLDVLSWAVTGTRDLTNATDKAYAVAALVQNSGNPAPPTMINAQNQKSAGQYRLINDFGGSGGGFHALGITPNPCQTKIVPQWVEAASSDSNADGKSGVSPSGETYQITEGRIGLIGQSVNATLTGNSTPYVWSVIEFDASVNPTVSNHAVFPTYYFYQNGMLMQPNYTQISPNTFGGYSSSYELLPSQIP